MLGNRHRAILSGGDLEMRALALARQWLAEIQIMLQSHGRRLEAAAGDRADFRDGAARLGKPGDRRGDPESACRQSTAYSAQTFSERSQTPCERSDRPTSGRLAPASRFTIDWPQIS